MRKRLPVAAASAVVGFALGMVAGKGDPPSGPEPVYVPRAALIGKTAAEVDAVLGPTDHDNGDHARRVRIHYAHRLTADGQTVWEATTVLFDGEGRVREVIP